MEGSHKQKLLDSQSSSKYSRTDKEIEEFYPLKILNQFMVRKGRFIC